MGTGRRQTGWFLALGAALGGLLLEGVPRACALDPDRRISQYAHTAWRVRDGLFAGAPIAIAQTADGYVWIGTHAGLVRFDGIRFVTWTPPAGKHLPSDSVNSLWGAADGSLWIGTAAGLAQWKNGDLINYPETQGRVNAIYELPVGRPGAVSKEVEARIRQEKLTSFFVHSCLIRCERMTASRVVKELGDDSH